MLLSEQKNCFTNFQESIASYSLPERFTFPFYYDPHPLCILAAKELQKHLINQTEWEYDFGLIQEKENVIIGKMFGVLLVQNQQNQIGYLSAFSGKLANKNHHSKFVPPVFDMLAENSFLKEGMDKIDIINQQIKGLEQNPQLLDCQKVIKKEIIISTTLLAQQKQLMKTAKEARKIRRLAAKEILLPNLFQILQKELSRESVSGKTLLKNLSDYWKTQLSQSQQELDYYNDKIAILKEDRKKKSAALQKKLFDQYQFLNQIGNKKSLSEIFPDSAPIGGSGECAAPKLLQYAFQHQMKPLAIAEFWWGQAPKSEIRKHGQFYPACMGKCHPILTHMLEGIPMDKNPLVINTAKNKKIEIIYEDEQLVVINKPTELLSVPGKNIKDSVFLRMKQRFPSATGPLIVHRLDMSTSGLMLIAKSKKVHKDLQYQFIKRTIKKQYVALIEGIIIQEEGIINLPLRVDLNDRPRQLVCSKHGKTAKTKWKIVEHIGQHTKIHFFPITGRTHQLRVHAAHPLGLNMPIVGDDLYGNKSNRLYLHAECIEFKHPKNKKIMNISVEASF